jgi:hypothetical protein
MTGVPDVESLAALCAEVIGVHSVAPEDNFFDVGGDSVSAAHLAVLLDERWGRRLDIFTIIAADSIRVLHEALAATGPVDRTGPPR